MSIYFGWKAASITTTSSAEVDLGEVSDFIDITLPTLATCTIKIQVAEKAGGTYYDLGDGITTASGTGGYADVFKLGGYQYIKVVASATQTTERLIRVRGGRY